MCGSWGAPECGGSPPRKLCSCVGRFHPEGPWRTSPGPGAGHSGLSPLLGWPVPIWGPGPHRVPASRSPPAPGMMGRHRWEAQVLPGRAGSSPAPGRGSLLCGRPQTAGPLAPCRGQEPSLRPPLGPAPGLPCVVTLNGTMRKRAVSPAEFALPVSLWCPLLAAVAQGGGDVWHCPKVARSTSQPLRPRTLLHAQGQPGAELPPQGLPSREAEPPTGSATRQRASHGAGGGWAPGSALSSTAPHGLALQSRPSRSQGP